MFTIDKVKITEKAKVGKMLSVFLAAVVTIFLALAANAQAFSITGKVVAIDRGQETLSVAAYNGPDYALSYKGGADRINTFALKRGAKVMRGSRSIGFGSLRVGDWVTVDYYEGGGGLVLADGIALTTPPKGEIMPTVFSIPGKVVAIDRDGRTLTLDPSYYYGSSCSGKRDLRVFGTSRTI
jgi:hypothetical protein